MKIKTKCILATVMALTIGVQAEIIGTGNVNIGSSALTWDAASGTALSITSLAKTFSSGDYAIDVKYTLTGNNAAAPASAFVGYNAAFAWVTSGNASVIDGADHLTLTAEVVELRHLGNPISLSNVQSANFTIHTMNVAKTNSNYEVNGVSYINDGTTSGLSPVALTADIATGYDIRFTNKFGQLWGSQASFEVEVDLTPDTTPPLIDTLAPANGATNQTLGVDMVATFDEGLLIGTGNITITNLTDGTATVIDVTDSSQVSIAGSILTINPEYDLSPLSTNAVLIDAGALTDFATNAFAGVSDTATWRFSTIVNQSATWKGTQTAEFNNGQNWNVGGVPVNPESALVKSGALVGDWPVLSVVMPTDQDPKTLYVGQGGETGQLTVNNSGDLRCTIQLASGGGTGTLILEDNAKVLPNIFRMNGTETNVVDMSGNAKFRSVNIGTFGANSYFTLAEGANLELPGNLTNLVNHADNSGQVRATDFAGGDRINAVFTTKTIFTVVNSLPIISSLNPANGANNVAVDSDLVATFDEDIAAGAGNITISNLTDGAATVIPVGDAQVSIAGADLTINPTTDLLIGKDYAVLIDAGAVEDLDGIPFAGIADTATWGFETVNIFQWLGSVDDDWNTPGNWSLGVVPGAGATASINGSPASWPVLSAAPTGGSITYLRIGDGTDGQMTLAAGSNYPGGFIVATVLQVGRNGATGTLNMPAGLLPTAILQVGDGSGGTGDINLSGHGILRSVTGNITFNSGTISIADNAMFRVSADIITSGVASNYVANGDIVAANGGDSIIYKLVDGKTQFSVREGIGVNETVYDSVEEDFYASFVSFESGGVDVYKSPSLTFPAWTNIVLDLPGSSFFVDTNATDAVNFYQLLPAGSPAPTP